MANSVIRRNRASPQAPHRETGKPTSTAWQDERVRWNARPDLKADRRLTTARCTLPHQRCVAGLETDQGLASRK